MRRREFITLVGAVAVAFLTQIRNATRPYSSRTTFRQKLAPDHSP
jgi:hypothetical protein